MVMRWMGAAAALMVLLGSAAAQAETIKFMTTLKGADETPPNTTAGTGVVMAQLDTATKAFTYKVTYSGLTGAATMAHFHGPAPAGKAAPVVVNFPPPVASPIHGSAVLTQGQIDQLMNGLWYVNVHTALHPPGEIRGQVEKVK